MALIRFGQGIEEIRGSINGTTFSRVRGGAIARSRTAGINPNTPFQDQVRSNFGGQASAFSSLTPAQIIGWQNLAAATLFTNVFGQTYTPSAKMMFMKVNLTLLSVESTGVLFAPTNSLMPAPPEEISFLLPFLGIGTVVAGNLATLELVNGSSQTGVKWKFFATPPLQAAIQDGTRYYRLIGNYLPGASLDLFADYTARFGVVQATSDEFILLRFSAVKTANGMESEAVDVRVDLT